MIRPGIEPRSPGPLANIMANLFKILTFSPVHFRLMCGFGVQSTTGKAMFSKYLLERTFF